MRPILIATMLFSTVAFADETSLSGHWQDAAGRRLFLNHKADGGAGVWMVVGRKQVGFGSGRVSEVSKRDDLTGISMWEIEAKSKENLIVRRGGGRCRLSGLSFSILGILDQSGWRGRSMELRAVGHIVGTLVCGKEKIRWIVPCSGTWKRL